MTAYVGISLALASTVVTLLGLGPLLRRLPPPREDPPDYASLATPRFRVGTAAAVLIAGLVVAWRDPHPWLWLPLLVVLVPACAIDARTTFLPLRLTQAAWVACVLAIALTAAMARDPHLALRACVGAAALGAAFWLAWRLGAVGFGDVRLMISVGAITAAAGWSLLVDGLLLGTVLGAGWGLARMLTGRGGGPFPYGPALLAGPFLALALGVC